MKAAAPECANRACAEWLKVLVDHLRTCGAAPPQDLAEVTAALRPGPDGAPIKVEPETVIPGQPIRPGVIGAQLDAVPAAELRRLLELAWDRSTFRDADADVLGVVEKWLAKAAPEPGVA